MLYAYQYSSDGISWTQGTLPYTLLTRGCAARSNMLVVFPTNGQPYVTTDGTTWTAYGSTFSGTVYRGIWDGTRFLFPTNNTGATGLFFSTNIDATTWSSIDVGSGGFFIAFDGSSTYIVGNAAQGTSGRICTSDPTVATNWTSITFPSNGIWIDAAYGNGIWVAIRAGVGDYATSTNGTTWTARTLPSSTSTLLQFQMNDHCSF